MSLVPDPDLDIRKPAFREKFLYYLKKNARPKLSLKLMQVSSYFCFRVFPYLVVKNLTNFGQKWLYLPLGQSDGSVYHPNYVNHEDIDLDHLEKPLWITNALKVRFYDSLGIGSELIPKFAVCQLKELYLANQFLKWPEFEFLVASKSVEKFTFHYGQIKYPDESIVPVDEVVKFMPNLKYFSWVFLGTVLKVTEETAKNLIAYLNPSILNYFELSGISEDFDFTLFSKFMHKHPSICFKLGFYVREGTSISDTYSAMLQDYVNKLVESGEYKTRRIFVCFPDANEKYNTILRERFYDD